MPGVELDRYTVTTISLTLKVSTFYRLALLKANQSYIFKTMDFEAFEIIDANNGNLHLGFTFERQNYFDLLANPALRNFLC
jgi:hypothetical protein